MNCGAGRGSARPARTGAGLLLDGPADLPEMLPEGVRRVGRASRQVIVEGRLLAQRLASPDPAGLLALGLPDLLRLCQHLPGMVGGDEHHTVVVPDDNVVTGHRVRPESRDGQGLGLPLGQALSLPKISSAQVGEVIE